VGGDGDDDDDNDDTLELMMPIMLCGLQSTDSDERSGPRRMAN
jgi:hypothetical protein